ncbi:succinate-semialdehyde dehydrogenase, mitochondrial-like [Pollicipes pollicipes]|uniref:succinate-semialdehyde dehydrogenase, mitochondrial-like n=1 Tax=Pollicipes pollicipes TaxID=41117 RepID=UPI001884D1D8|nr:succinate-semialdehyde dehydrogenase, mitochondrial-like [Pollicipes pollicipes]
MSLTRTELFVDGHWRKSSDGSTFEVVNPANGARLQAVSDATAEDVRDACQAAASAFAAYRKTTVKERTAILHKIRDLLLESKKEIGEILCLENGKPLAEAEGEVGFAASFFDWFGAECRRAYGQHIPPPAGDRQLVTVKQPCGVAAIITPWNFPIGMLARKTAAALAAGCSVVIKPAEDTPLTALAFAAVCERAGLPRGLVNVVPCSRGRVAELGRLLCAEPLVRLLSFTGSTAVGRLLYRDCADAVKRIHLELGGNAPFVVFDSAPLELTVRGALAAKFRNTGQTCVSTNRLFVQAGIYDRFVEALAEGMKKTLQVGDGMVAGNNQGPLINKRQLEKVQALVADAMAHGAQVVMGGRQPPQGGLFYEPTLLTSVSRQMRLYTEEIFGPVVAVYKFSTEEEVIQMANDTNMGLAGYFYTSDYQQSWRVAMALDYGLVGVNEALISTCEAPFGGFKHSGFGKEGGQQGLDDFMETKYICFGGLKL